MIYLVMGAFLWGTSFIAGKFAYDMFDPALTVSLTLVIASLAFLPTTVAFFKNTSSSFQKKDLMSLAVVGFLTYPVTLMLQFLGLSLTSASSTVIIIGLEPLMVALVGYLFFKDKAAPVVFLLGIMAFVGVFLMIGVSQAEQVSFTGCFLVFIATIVVAFWIRLSKKVMDRIDPRYYTALSIQLGTLLGLPVMLLFVKSWEIHYSLQGILAVLYLGVGGCLLAGWLWNKGLERVSSNRSGVFLVLEPMFGVVFAVLVLDEKVDWISLVGIALVILSATLCALLPNDKI